MGRLLLVLLGVAALLVPGAANGAKSLTIQVVSDAVSIRTVDSPPKGSANKGDRIVYRDNLTNPVRQFGRKKGAKVGSDRGVMTFTGPRSARYVGSTRLPGGTLKLRGKVTGIPNGFSIPVVGGTGRYAGATGRLLVGPGERPLNVYELTLPVSIA
jgi:hypothetical protein